MPDEPRISGGDSCAQHPVAGRSGRRRGLFPAGCSQIQPRRPAGCRYRLFGCHRQKPRIHDRLHLPGADPYAHGQLRRRAAGFPRGDRPEARPAGRLLQPGLYAPAEQAIRGGDRGFRQIHLPGKQGSRRLHRPRHSLPLPEGHRTGPGKFRPGDPHQPRKSQRLLPTRNLVAAKRGVCPSRSRFRYVDPLRFDFPAALFQPGGGLFQHQPSDAGPRGFRPGATTGLDQLVHLFQPGDSPHPDRRLQPRTRRLRPRGALLPRQCPGLLPACHAQNPLGRPRRRRARLHPGHRTLPRLRQRLPEPQRPALCVA